MKTNTLKSSWNEDTSFLQDFKLTERNSGPKQEEFSLLLYKTNNVTQEKRKCYKLQCASLTHFKRQKTEREKR